MASSQDLNPGKEAEIRGRMESWQSTEDWKVLQSDMRDAVNRPFSDSSILSLSPQMDEVFVDILKPTETGTTEGQNDGSSNQMSSEGAVRSRERLLNLYENREQRRENLERIGVSDFLSKVLTRSHVAEGAPATVKLLRETIAHSINFSPLRYEVEILRKEKAETEVRIGKIKERIIILKERVRKTEEAAQSDLQKYE